MSAVPPRNRSLSVALPLVLALSLTASGCQRPSGNAAPPRVETPATLPDQSSTIVVPVTAQLADLERGLEARAPRLLWRIDKHEPRCVPEQRVKVFGRKIKVTPALGCRIVGQVTRGRLRLGGSGETLTITMPVSATISARDVGGILARETATGSALVHARARLSVDRRWTPTAKIDIDYDWVEPPGIDFLGQRISFVDKADERLKAVIVGLERDLPRELAKIRTRERLGEVWRRAFTSISLNRERPPAWLRVTPRRLGFGGYRVAGRELQMLLSAEALTQTFVGDRPPDPAPTALPPPSLETGRPGLRFFVPVIADYRQLEPVVARALRKLAARGISISGVGPVDAKFGDVTIYATEAGHIAVGIKTEVKGRANSLVTTKGEIWLTAIPYNDPGSQVVRVRDLGIAGQTDSDTVNLLFALFRDTAVLANVRESLVHDFARDYQKVLGAAQRAIAGHREGDFLLKAQVTSVENGRIAVTGQGLFLPIRADGRAEIVYRPR
ncbi:DUF4403 family protein [Sphingomonas sp. Tas61C01]|uniref:DUF4403 family protein n=1 Tax=Sphingomonas sp. Tas61C01 TaxID=3458297 RepID=UPI00403EF390